MNLLTIIDQEPAWRLSLTLLHFLWQGLVTVIVIAFLLRLLREAPSRLRYLVLIAGMPAMVLCVLTTFLLVDSSSLEDGQVSSQRSVGPMANVSSGDSRAVDFRVQTPLLPAGTGSSDSNENSEASEQQNASDQDAIGPAPASDARTPGKNTGQASAIENAMRPWAPVFVCCYLAGVIVLLARVAIGFRGSSRIGKTSRAVTESRLLVSVSELAMQMKIAIVPPVRWCADVAVPVVIGVTRPVILLPVAAATGMSEEQLCAVIAHELAHVRRFDLLLNLMQRVVESLLFFHPAVWWLSRRISMEREYACDELVLSAGYQRARYADALLSSERIVSFGP